MNKQAVAEEQAYEISPEVLLQSFSWFSDRILVRGQLSLRRSKRRSYLFGLSGILFLACLAAAIFIIVIHLYDLWFEDDSLGIMALTACSIYSLVASTLAIASFVPLIGGGRLILRFLVAIVIDAIVFVVLLAVATGFGEPEIHWEDVPEVGLMTLAFVLGVAVVAVSLQFWTSISVKPLPSDLDPTARSSILDLMELMLVVACTIAFLRFIAPADDMTMTLIISGSIGLCLGIQLIPFFLGFFSNSIKWRLLAIAFGMTFIVGAVCAGLIIIEDLDTIESGSAALIMATGGFLAASINCFTTIAAFSWLRGCGWAKIRRASTGGTSVVVAKAANPNGD